MIKVTILKNNIITNQAQFATQELAETWYATETANKSFGSKEVVSIDSISGQEVISIEPADVDVVFENISAQLLAEQEAKEALQYLKDTDFYIIREMDAGTPCPPEIKAARAAARLKI